jgi:ferrochelatase
MAADQRIAVLVMAYGGPSQLQDVEPYLRDVRNYRETPDHLIEEVRSRYQLIGGRSPILERTQAQAEQLNQLLADKDGQYQTFVGMRHWKPFLKEAVAEISAAGIHRVIGLVMAPHYSRMSIQAYLERLNQAIEENDHDIQVVAIESWKLAPGYLTSLEQRIESALDIFPRKQRQKVRLIFTAHSLPQRILDWGDPYPEELQATFEALRDRFPGHESHFAYQSAAMTPEPWLGPDAGDLMEELLKQGEADKFLIIPIGFVSEHVEILYDIDIDYKQRIENAGGQLRRIDMPADDQTMMSSLAGLVQQKAQQAGWL